MTLVVVWVRRVKATEELVVASDSRLTGGMTWDEGPKIFQLSRGDAVLAFAGATYYAYPIILQVIHAVNEHDRSADRSQSLNDLKGHLERLVQQHLSRVRDRAADLDFSLVLAGYSAKYRRWETWESRIDAVCGFQFQRRRPRGALFVGDAVPKARENLMRLLPGAGKSPTRHQKLDWEPMDVLRDIIRAGDERSIGGPIQVVKVYKHLASMPFGVLWKVDGARTVTMLGRSLLDYEQTKRLIIDPDTHRVLRKWKYLDAPAPDNEPSSWD